MRKPDHKMIKVSAGTFTFLFTDIEGSTRLLQRLGDDYRLVLEDHNRLIRAAIDQLGGTEVHITGDGFFFVFQSAPQALAAAIAAQRSLNAHDWPRGGSLRVRMGLHTGTATVNDGDYVGFDIHRAARITSSGYGGQILVSSTSLGLIKHEFPSDITFRDLGRFLLKDIEEPEHLFQVVVPGLLSDFPPPRSIDVRPHNLPSEVTDFVNREKEIREIDHLISENRLLTLTGPGGTGKTRLALRVATKVLPKFEDGVYFIPLASIQDPQLVVSTIGKILQVSEGEGRPIPDLLAEYLSTKELLLILDNLEQIIDAAPQVSDLLRAAPDLKVIATSRTLLRISGEQVFQVLPLEVPREDEIADLNEISRVDGVDLFVRRARTANPDFVLTSQNAVAVAQIVKSLEGLPLAIELAAVHARLFPPAILAKRLEHRFKVLRSGPKDLPERHRAIRDTIAWSYELLEPSEQRIFRRLAIFVGGFSLEAAEIVAGDDPVADVIESVTALLDKSLLKRHVQQGEVRISMLEMIREFALEELEASGEAQQIVDRHVSFFLSLAEETEPYLTRREQVATIDRLSHEVDNFRAALRSCIESGNIEIGLRMAGALWRFWHAIGQLQEGRRVLERLLSQVGGSPQVRAKGLTGLAGLAYWQADYPEALTRYEQALELYRNIGDKLNEADTLLSMSTTFTWSGDLKTGGRLADQALNIFERLRIRDKEGMALMAKGFVHWMEGDLDRARPLWEESLNIALDVGDHIESATKRLALASIIFQQGDREQALRSSLDALEALVRLKNVTLTIMALDWVAAIATHGDPDGGVRLAGAAAALRAKLGGGMKPESSGLESVREVAIRNLNSNTIDKLWSEGQEMGFDQAIEYARKVGAALLFSDALHEM